MMRRAALAALALLPLVAAAPLAPANAGAVMECGLSYADAGKAVEALNILRSSGEDPEAKGGVVKYYNPDGVTVLGAPVTQLVASEFVSDGVHRKIFRADIATPFAPARAAMLKLHRKASCDAHETTTAGERDCMIHVREEGATETRDVDMALFETEEGVAIGCIYSRK